MLGVWYIAPQPASAGRIDYVRLIDWMNQLSGQNEGCLVLNVWTPAIKDGGKRPVLVSLHGGGFTSGSSGHSGFNGQPLAGDRSRQRPATSARSQV